MAFYERVAVDHMDAHHDARDLGQRLDGRQPLAERQRALIDLVDLATDHLRRFLASRHLTPDRLEEVAAETWLTVIQKIQAGAFKAEGGDPINYVIGVAANLLKRIPPAHTHETALDEATQIVDPQDAFGTSEVAFDVAHVASSLDNPEDQAVLEELLAEHSIGEMAAKFGCSYKTAWRRYHRCLTRCRAALIPPVEVVHDATYA